MKEMPSYCHDVFQSWWWCVPSVVIITVVDIAVPIVHHLKDEILMRYGRKGGGGA
jgi:hypothetical protein